MTELQLPKLIGWIRQSLFFAISLIFVAWYFWPDYKSVFGGLVVGLIASLVNVYHLYWKVKKIGTLASMQSEKKTPLGFLTRAAIAVLAYIFSVQYGNFSATATIAALVVAPLITLLVSWANTRRQP